MITTILHEVFTCLHLLPQIGKLLISHRSDCTCICQSSVRRGGVCCLQVCVITWLTGWKLDEGGQQCLLEGAPQM